MVGIGTAIVNIGRGIISVWNAWGPEIVTGVGMGMTAIGAVKACKDAKTEYEATREADEELEKLEGIHNGTIKLKNGIEYTDAQYRKDVRMVQIKRFHKLSEHYAVSGGLVTGGLALTAIGSVMSRRRNTRTAGIVTALTQELKRYRNGVKELYGEDADKDILLGAHRTKVLNLIDDGSGNQREEEQVIVDYEPIVQEESNPAILIFSRETCPDTFSGDIWYDINFLKGCQDEMKGLLRMKRHVTKSDVQYRIGHNITPDAFDLGWVSVGDGDGFVDFGIFDHMTGDPKSWVFDYYKQHGCIPLELNFDGDIRSKVLNRGNKLNGEFKTHKKLEEADAAKRQKYFSRDDVRNYYDGPMP